MIDKHALQKTRMTFVPIIFTASGGMGEQFQGHFWHPHWARVEKEDAEMGILPWASRARKAVWMARFGTAILVIVARCNASMISL